MRSLGNYRRGQPLNVARSFPASLAYVSECVQGLNRPCRNLRSTGWRLPPAPRPQRLEHPADASPTWLRFHQLFLRLFHRRGKPRGPSGRAAEPTHRLTFEHLRKRASRIAGTSFDILRWKNDAECVTMKPDLKKCGSALRRTEREGETECFVEHGALIWSKF